VNLKAPEGTRHERAVSYRNSWDGNSLSSVGAFRVCLALRCGWRSTRDDVAYIYSCRLERRPEIRDRIAYLTRQAEELIAEKRQRIEETLWAIHDTDLPRFFGPRLA
jgi:hypothetical protein